MSRGIIVSALALGAVLPLEGQVPNRHQPLNKYGTKYLVEIPTQAVSAAWTNRPWSGDAEPFRAVRIGLEARFARLGFDAEGEFARLGLAAQAKPTDVMAQFRWGTLGFLLGQSFLLGQRDVEHGIGRWEGYDGSRLRGRIRWGLALAPDPANAEYDRLRYLYEAAGSVNLFRELGKRLILKWPGDEALLKNQPQNLGNSHRESDVAAAVAFLDKLTQRHPKDLRYVALKGDVYRVAWINFHRREYALGAIECSELYHERSGVRSANEKAIMRAKDSLRRQIGLPVKGS